MLSRQTLTDSPLFVCETRESHLQLPALSLRLSSTCYYQTQPQANPDSGSDQWAAFRLRMCRSDKAVDKCNHMKVDPACCAASFEDLLFKATGASHI